MTSLRAWALIIFAAHGALLASCGGGGSGANTNPPPPPPATGGLDARLNNATCVAPARAALGTIGFTAAFPGLPRIGSPTKVLVEPVADPRWFVLRKSGQLVVFDPDAATGCFAGHCDRALPKISGLSAGAGRLLLEPLAFSTRF